MSEYGLVHIYETEKSHKERQPPKKQQISRRVCVCVAG